MPKYILKDSTGQIWNDIDDNNISEFMEQYPGAEIIETIDDVIEVEDDIESLKQEPVDDSIDSPESIKQVVSDYDTNAIALKEAFRDVSIEGRSQLNDSDFELAKNGQWDEISEDGKNIMLNLYPTTGRFDEDKPKDFDSLKNYLAQLEIDIGAGVGVETSSYDDYNILGSSFASAQENADKRNKFKNDLNLAINDTKKGEIPTNILTGGLGEVIIGNEEEKVADTLSKLYSPYGFQFSKSDSGLDYFTDDLIVQAGNGKKIKIKLDNWTNNGDKEQAEVLKNFLESNKEEYQQNTFQNILKKSSELNEMALATSNEDTKWYDNFLTDIEKVSEDQEREWNNVYDERIVKQETKSVETQLVQLNTEYSLNQAKINKFTNDAAKLQSDIDNGLIPLNDIKQRQAELETLRVELKKERSVLDKTWGQKIKPAIADLTVVAAKQSLVEEGRGSFGSMTAFQFLKPWENIGTYLNGISLASAQGEIEDIADGDEVKLKKLLDREAKMVVFDGFTKNIDISNEYQQAFQESMAGAAYSSIVNMASIALPSLAVGLTTGGLGGKIAYGIGMGAHIAGGELAEMQTEDFAGMSPKEKLAFASTVGAVSGTIEGIFGPGGTLLGKGLLKGVSKIAGAPLKAIRNKVLSEVLKKTVGKKVSQSFIKKTAKEVSEKFAKTGVIGKITSEFVKGGLTEAATEITQEAATLKLKQVWAENSEANSPLWSEAAKEITFDKLAQAGVLGFLAGGPFGAMSGGVEASKAGKVAELKQMQYRMYKNHMLNPKWQNLASSKELLNVLDPENKLTEEGAKKVLRNFNESASVLREVDGLGLTIEGEQKAVDLINQKNKLQKQIDKATDKALVKRQREEITAINSKLEDLSVNYNFESAFEAGLEQARETTEASGKSFTEFNSSKEFEAKMKELGEQDDAGFKGTSGYIDKDGNIYINREAAKNLKDISVGQHELLHGVTAKQLGKVDPETIQEFKNSLTNRELKVVEKRLKDAYGVTSVEDANAEEYFNALVDGVVQGDIRYSENVFTKIGDFIVKNILRPMGFSNVQLGFKDGRQVYNFVKDYAKQSKRIAEGKQEGFEGEIGDIVAEGTASLPTGAKSAQTISDSYKKIDEFSKNPDFDIDSEFDTKRLLKEAGGIIESTTSRLYDRTAQMNKEDVSREDFKRDLEALFTEVYKAYDEDMDVNMQGAGRQTSNLFNLRANKLATDTFKQTSNEVRSDQSTLQIAAEEDASKDTRTDREIRQDERKGVKVREKLPNVYNVGSLVKSIRSKAKGKSFKGKNIKQLKGFALREVVDIIARDNKDLADSMFKKLEKNSDLNKPEMLAIQKFINSNIDLAKGSLLEGYTSEFKASGVVNKLLEKFYNKRSVRSKTGPGLQVQIKKPNISDIEFKEAFGITGRDQANWNQKVAASKGGVSDILKGFVRNFDQVISSQEIREQKIIDGDAESASKLAEAIPQGFFSKNSNADQGKSFDEILNDIYGIEKIDNKQKAQILGDALRIKLFENPQETIGDIIRAVSEGLEIKEGFAYEQVLYDVINDAVAQYDIPGLQLSAGPTEVGGAADIVLTYYGQEIGIEAKKGNARFGSVTAKYDEDGNLIIKKDYTFNKLLNKMLKDAKPEIDAYVKEANVIGKRLFGKKYIPIKYITDAMPQEVYNELQIRGFQKRITQNAKVNTDFVSELYWAKKNGTSYIQIQGLGTYYLTDPSNTNLENPLNLDVPPFSADLILSFATGSNTANNPAAYDNNDLEVKTKNAKGNPLKRALPGSTGFRRISLRFQPSKITGLEKSSLQLDQPVSVAKAFSQADLNNQITKEQEGAFKDNKQEGFFSKVIDPNNTNNSDLINEFSKMDEALELANSLDQPVKKIRVFDFDDTLATSNNVVFANKGGETIILNAEQFAKRGDKLLDEGYEFDFSDFNTVKDGEQGPLFDIAKRIKAARGSEDLFVLTARNPDAQQAIYEFLKSQGLEIPLENIVGLGNSTGEAKAQWLVGKAAEGYNDFYFADDALANVRAVKESMSKLDVKSKTQLVKQNKIQPGKFSKTKLDFTTDEVGNMKSSFNIKDKNYVISLDPVDNQGDYRYEFELKTKTGATQDITGTGDAVAVFRKVYNSLVNAIRQNADIKRVEFSATKAEPSRISLYTSIMEKLGKELGWETDIWESTSYDGSGSFDFEISKPRTKQPSSIERVLNVVDVKSKTQESRGRFSKQMSDDFNRIIEETEGVGRQKVYSEARAKQIGSQKGKRKFWIPFSAEDMLGLIYPLLGKGKTGDAQMKWFKENLFNPFSKAMDSLAAARVQLMADFKALKENLDVPKDLQKEAFDGFTNEQALRMYIWDLQGMEVPGVSKRDLADAKKIIEGNEKLKLFGQMLIQINKSDGYPKPSQSWLAGTITTDLIEGLNTVKRAKFLEQWQQNVDAIFSKENLNKLEAIHGSNYREALENMLTRMKTGKNRIEGSNRMSDRVLDWINGSVGAIMFFNTRSAVLQLISSINFINWSDNNLYAAGKAFANQKQYWSDFKMLINSDFLVDRRNGLKINVSESEIADAAKTSKNKARAVLNYILKKGFLPTQIADSFAIASGGATFYRNRVNTYLSEGMTQKDAEAKAFQDFRETSEESQQSSRPDKVSQQQASSLGRILLAFANTPMQYGRLTKRAYQDLINGRGDRKTNISKIIYYTAVQNMIFNVLQQAVTMLGFGDDEKSDEEKEEKYIDVANGMADSILRGLGIAGGAVSVAKNFLLDLYERSGRSRPEYVDSVYKLLQFSPPISSKVSKLRQAAWMFDSKKRREEIYDKGFALDNPAYEAAGKVISATTNLPVDRVYNKVNNIDAALAEDTETWESIAMLLGWPEWQIKPNKKKTKSKSKKGGYKSRSGRLNKPSRNRKKKVLRSRD